MKAIYSLITAFVILFSTTASALEIAQKDYITLVVGNYVHGFKEFDTSVTAFDDSVSIGIYYDSSTQDDKRAKQLAKHFESQIPN